MAHPGSIPLPLGPKPSPPKNITVVSTKDGILISWEPPSPSDSVVPVAYYDIEYRTNETPTRKLNKKKILGETTKYLGKQYLI